MRAVIGGLGTTGRTGTTIKTSTLCGGNGRPRMAIKVIDTRGIRFVLGGPCLTGKRVIVNRRRIRFSRNNIL